MSSSSNLLRSTRPRTAVARIAENVERVRESIDLYTDTQERLWRELVGQINGEFSTPDWTPLVYLRRNGLVDDGLLVLTRDVGGNDQRIVLCRGVREYFEGEVGDGDDDNGNGLTDERGFHIQRVDGVLFVRLSLEESVPTGSVVRTLETAVRLRN